GWWARRAGARSGRWCSARSAAPCCTTPTARSRWYGPGRRPAEAARLRCVPRPPVRPPASGARRRAAPCCLGSCARMAGVADAVVHRGPGRSEPCVCLTACSRVSGPVRGPCRAPVPSRTAVLRHGAGGRRRTWNVPGAAGARHASGAIRGNGRASGRSLDGDALAPLLLLLAQAHADLEDAPVVGGLDVVLVGARGERDRPGERAVPELRALRLPLLVAPLGVDGQDPVRQGDLDVLVRVDAGQLGPEHVPVVLDEVLEADLPPEHRHHRPEARERL